MSQTTVSAQPTAAHTPATTPTSGAITPGRGGAIQKKSLRGQDLATQLEVLTPSAPVQRKGGGDAAEVHAAAERGTQGSGGALPHMARIQQSFGKHDVSGIQAHVGGQAREASAAMGAEAFATGNHVAFGKSPSLHTAAHEAAHIVQQRAGVSLQGGVGKSGDPYERHADQVADAVVQGKSAEGLLDRMAGGRSGKDAPVQRRAVQRSGPGHVPGTGALGGVTGSVTVTPGLKATTPPENFEKSVAKYGQNFEKVKGNISARGGTAPQVAAFEGKKGDWYHRWGVAALQNDAESPQAQAEFQAIRADLVTLFPDDSPSDGGGHLYTGYAAGGSGRDRAEGMMESENAKPANQAAGITHRTLETTLVGNLFDGVANSPRDAAEKPKWIPWSGSQARQWWSHISAEYANTFTGAVHAHVDIGFPYFVKREVVDKNPGGTLSTLRSQLAPLIKLDASVFRDDECPRIATLMADGDVTSFEVHLRLEKSPGNIANVTVSIPPAGVTDGPSLIAKIDQGIRANCSAAELEPNLPPDPAPATGGGTSGGATGGASGP